MLKGGCHVFVELALSWTLSERRKVGLVHQVEEPPTHGQVEEPPTHLWWKKPTQDLWRSGKSCGPVRLRRLSNAGASRGCDRSQRAPRAALGSYHAERRVRCRFRHNHTQVMQYGGMLAWVT